VTDTGSPRVELVADCDDILCYAASQSGRRLVRSIQVRSLGPEALAGAPMRLSVAIEAPLNAAPAAPFAVEFLFQDVAMPPNPRMLGLLEEKVAAEIVIQVEHEGRVIAQQRSPVAVLAYNQWMHREDYYETLAAFVLPGHDDIDQIAAQASTLLEKTTGDGSLQGYQSGPRRAREIATAIYEAIAARKLGYIDPPASFEGYGQKIRTPDAVIAEGRGTCLETTVLYAAALARAGLLPVLFIARGHAFAGFVADGLPHQWHPKCGWPTPELFDLFRATDAVIETRNDIVELVSSKLITAVETTTLTASRLPFEVACDQVTPYFKARSQDLLAMVIVDRAWALGVMPVAARKRVGGDIILIEQPTPERVKAAPPPGPADDSQIGDEITQRSLGAFQGPGRVRQWLASLLDLSRRNRLLNLSVNSSQWLGARCIEFDVPLGLLPVIEDRINGERGIEIAPPTRLPMTAREGGHLESELVADFQRTGRLYWPPACVLPDVIKDARRLVEQEAERQGRRLPAAEVERTAADMVSRTVEAALHTRLAGLKQSTKEIEDLTGSNSLFLTIGMLSWEEDAVGYRGKGVATWSAPLFLVPVKLTGARGTPLRITIDESAEITPNYCLREKLRQTYGLDIEELETPLLDDAGIDVRHLVAAVRGRLRDGGPRSAAVEERCLLAVLNYSSFRLWKDLRDHWKLFSDTSPVVRHLIERPQEHFVDPAGETPLVNEPLCPIEADDSQRQAVAWAVSGRSFVLQGPPGTGKSQTIANLLAGALAEKRSVLFVAEKQPALQVVKSRLEAVGLAPFCLDLHAGGDSQTQVREKLRRQLNEAIEAADTIDERRWSDVAARHRVKSEALDRYRDAVHSKNQAGFSVWTARQELHRLGDGPVARISREFVAAADEGWPPAREALLQCAQLEPTVAPVAEHPWSLVERADYPSLDRAALRSALEEWAAAAAEVSEFPSPWSVLSQASTPACFDAFLRLASLVGRDQLPSPADLERVRSPQWRAVANAALGKAKAAVADFAPVLAFLEPTIWDQDTATLAQQSRAVAGSSFAVRHRRIKAFVIVLGAHAKAGTDPRVVAEAVIRAHELHPRVCAGLDELAAIPGIRIPAGWKPVTSEALAGLEHQLEELEGVAAATADPAFRSVVQEAANGLRPDALVVAGVERARAAWAALGRCVAWTPRSLERWAKGKPVMTAWKDRVPELLTDGREDRFLALQRWCRVLATLDPLHPQGLSDLANAMLSGRIHFADAPDAALRGLLRACLQERLEAGEIDRFDGLAHDQTLVDFATLDGERRQMIRRLIPARLVAQRTFRPGEGIGEYGELQRELERKRRRLPVRNLMSKYGKRLLELTPCFLMSPDSVATYLPPGAVTFDLVVFDEASQIKVAEAVGALGRGRAAIVVGDTKQMPPSFSFSAGAHSEGDDEFYDETEADDSYVAEDMESILDECHESNLAELRLTRHYRSRHESLIAFSNRSFYESSLLTFPSPDPSGAALSFRRIGGQFLRKSSKSHGELLRTNPAEADAIVAEVLSRLDNPATANDSICVVTFNLPQMHLVQSRLIEQGGPEIATLLEERRQTVDTNAIEPQLKIRNLETVQGDEADVVLFSVAFSAPEPEVGDTAPLSRRVPLRFGPLNLRGGERRLNVAVSRARKEMVVFCSFEPEDLPVRDSSPAGIRLLRRFLEIARYGAEHTGDLQAHAPTARDYHLTDIAQALRDTGLKVAEHFGLSRFKVDLAVGQPDEPGWRLAVLLDGPAWADAGSTFEREVLPVQILRTVRKWRAVARVWLPAWLSERERVLGELVAAANAEPPEPEVAAERPAGVPAEEPEAAPAPETAEAAEPAVRLTSGSEPDPETADWFVPFAVSARGLPAVLDELDGTRNRTLVRQLLQEIVDTEGPVEVDRLCKLAARCFGLNRVREARIESLRRLIPPNVARVKSRLGTFVWPARLDPVAWRGFRNTPPGTDRPLEEIAPEEIANAMVDLAQRGGSMDVEEVYERLKTVFGFSRLAAVLRDRLEKVLHWAAASGRIRLDGSRVYAGETPQVPGDGPRV
jgi:hypothetical protein